MAGIKGTESSLTRSSRNTLSNRSLEETGELCEVLELELSQKRAARPEELRIRQKELELTKNR